MKKFLEDFIYLFLERGEERERNMDVKESCYAPAGGLAGNPRMCPDSLLNQQPFGSQVHTQSPEPHQPGLSEKFLLWI